VKILSDYLINHFIDCIDKADEKVLKIPSHLITESKCKQILEIELTKSIQSFLKTNFKEIRVGKNRIRRHHTLFYIRLFFKLPDYLIGEYQRGLIKIRTPKYYWTCQIEKYLKGKEVSLFYPFVFNTDMMLSLVHELSHLFQDILGDTFQNNAYLEIGKALEEEIVSKQEEDKYGSALIHFSRISEIISYASEAAYDIFRIHYPDNYENILKDFCQGKFNNRPSIRRFLNLNKDISDENILRIFEKIKKDFFLRIFKNLESLIQPTTT
jgi:hypothetical protein